MNRYLAKSDPMETIQDHTDKLLENYKILKEMYPNLEVNWGILYKACLYHDLGKMNSKFQDKIERQKRVASEIPHGILSLAFIDYEKMEEGGFSEDEIKTLFHAIAYHHERELKYEDCELEMEIELLANEYDGFNYDKLKEEYYLDQIDEMYFYKNDRIYENEDIFFKYIMIKGLLNRLDYAASGQIEVEKKNDFLENSLNNLLNEWKKKKPTVKWNELQEYMIRNRDKNLVVIAQTGMGKTEAGLLWIANSKGFFTLPLKTAINSIYDRVVQIVKENKQNRVGLLHSDTLSEYINRNEVKEYMEYYNMTKQMSLPLTICTLDQIFDFVYKYRGFESKLATLAYSKIVIDEIQMYSPDLLAYLIVGLSNINKVGGKFVILTATLPSFILNLLEDEGIKFEMPERPFINKTLNARHSIKIINDEIDIEYIKSLYNKNKVLVICNTVKKAQEVYSKLKDDDVENLNLFHSRFIKADRKEKEDSIYKFGRLKNKEHGIWIATQVVEASLDIDFDILVTELSDINGLFQRLGRCYRSRNFSSEGYNCYVYIDKCSGVRYAIDEEIHELSKGVIRDIDGLLDEEEKISIIEDVYSYEKLKNTNYFKKVKNIVKYVNNFTAYEKSKNEAKKEFRNIESINIIPKVVYERNEEIIDEYVRTISGYVPKLPITEKEVKAREKIESRNKLSDFVCSVKPYYKEGNIFKVLKLSDYEEIIVLDCNYSKYTGVELIKRKDKKENEKNNCKFL